MASSHPEAQLTWASSSSKTLSSSTQVDTDEFLFNVEDMLFDVTVYVDNQGTPANGDVVNVGLKFTPGDIKGDSGNDYDTAEHLLSLGQLDTYSTNTSGEDPAQKTFYGIPRVGTGFKGSVDSPNAATRNMVVRMRVVTHRGQ